MTPTDRATPSTHNHRGRQVPGLRLARDPTEQKYLERLEVQAAWKGKEGRSEQGGKLQWFSTRLCRQLWSQRDVSGHQHVLSPGDIFLYSEG